MEKQRIWELDAFRGICILGMIVVHAVLDVKGFGSTGNALFDFVREWGSLLFILISGICLTLGSRSIRRGLIVFGAGMLCTLVTWGMYKTGMESESIIIRFGILHCLGICMILAAAIKKAPTWALFILAAVLIYLGFYVKGLTTDCEYLFPLGIRYTGFSSSDYFPLLPNFGYFVAGMFIGKTLYAKKQSLMPNVKSIVAPLRFLSWCGRQSLFIYLLHQPILYGVAYVIQKL